MYQIKGIVMLDNKEMELEALEEVKSKILKCKYSYADLSCDKNGVDLYAFKGLGKDSFRIIKVQSKGRNITDKNSNVRIYKKYVTDDFVCFLYLKKEDDFNDYLYLFFHDDIVQWPLIEGKDDEHDEYKLNIGKYFIDENEQYRINSKRAKLLDELFEKQPPLAKPRCFDHTSLLRSFYDLWCEYGIRPDENALKIIEKDTDVFNYNEQIGIFLACLYLIHEDKGDFFGIDWFVNYIKDFDFFNEIDESLVIQKGNTYCSNYGFSYSSSVDEIQYGDTGVDGFHLYIGDNEEKYDVYLLRDGRYGVIKTK